MGSRDYMFKSIKWVFRQLASTMFDDCEFKFISLPRVWYFTAGVCVVISWISEQYLGLKFSGFSQLIVWFGICAGAYVGKKCIDKKGEPPK